eukprot:11055580-Heterocapsa_arctica.AAC.1
MVRLLCGAGADKDKAGTQHCTPLILAIMNANIEAMSILCGAGVDRTRRAKRDTFHLIELT